MKAIILAAGIGSRLGNPRPKPLTVLSTGEQILARQIRHLQRVVMLDDIYIVIGFKKDLIMEEQPDLTFVFNNVYDQTNTSKSLLRALRKVRGEDVLWMNGDVVFDVEVLQRLVAQPSSCLAVNTESVGAEEIKYTLSADGTIRELSKTVENALGESVGVNKIMATDIPLLVEMLERCAEDDYFERGIEFAIEKGMKIYPVDISDSLCVEVDFTEDLEEVNKQLDKR